MFWYAAGPYRESTRVAGSAFTKGNLLAYNTASQLVPVDFTNYAQGLRIAGVAKADSSSSIDSEVPFIVAESETVFWADIDDNLTSQLTDGQLVGAKATSGDHVIDSAATALFAIAARGDHRAVIDSDRSRVRVSLLGANDQQAFL